MTAQLNRILGTKRSRGSSLIEVLIGAGLVAAVAAGGASYFGESIKFQAKSDVASMVDILRDNIRGFMDCKATMASSPSSGNINIRNADSKIIVAANGSTVIGKFHVRARVSDREVYFDYKEPDSNTWESLFNDIPIYCKATDTPAFVEVPIMVFWADDGTRISFDLATGRWGELDVFNPSYDHNVCQDFVGFDAGDGGSKPMKITLADGNVLNFPLFTWWRMNPGCGDYYNGKIWQKFPKIKDPKQMPGQWGANLYLKSSKVTMQNSDEGNAVKVYQKGTKVYFEGYHSSVFKLEMELGSH